MSKVNLFVSVYNESHKERKGELDFCLNKNITNSSIDHVYILLEPGATHINKSEKEIIILMNNRPRFNDFFKHINNVSEQNDINIIINSDIFFEEVDIKKIKANLTTKKCFALTRYDFHNNSTYTFLNRWDSQDSWCFLGHIKYDHMECGFQLGKPGCDNRIAYELNKLGYDVSNPSMSIRSFHVHNSHVRYYKRTPEQVVNPPYLTLTPIL